MQLIIVSGMLGVGKTSVILKIVGPLAEGGRKLVIIENDFGTLGIDSDIVRRNGMEVRELKGGCICCTLKAGLIDDLRLLQANFEPDVVVVEPTGIADPEFIINSVQDISGLRIDSITTLIVIDAERFLKMKKMFERPLKNQLKVADLVLLNKVDTVSSKDLNEIERGIRAFSYNGKIWHVQADKGIGLDAVAMEIIK